MPRHGPTIADAALRLIHERGPQDLDALVPEIVDAGLTRARDPRRAVLAAIESKPDFLPDWEGRWCSLADQLEGAIFTHRLTSLERQDEIVILPDDLHLVERLVLRGGFFARGGDLHLDFVGDFFELPSPDMDPDGAWDELGDELDSELFDDLLTFAREMGVPYELDDRQAVDVFLEASRYQFLVHGPPGWLPTLLPDDLLGLRVRGGVIERVRIGPREVRGAHVGIVAAQVAKLARLVIGPDPSWFGPPVITIVDLLRLVATEAPELFRRPLPPFSEVVERGGLEVSNGLVGHIGTDWAAAEWSLAPSPQAAWGFEPGGRIQ
jgi:hypothetical protein